MPVEHMIRGISGVALLAQPGRVSADLLSGLLGFDKVDEEYGRERYLSANPSGSFADILHATDETLGQTALGTTHYMAWRAPDEETQVAWREEIDRRSFRVAPVLDRNYFRSVYFRKPGGVLFEIATHPPGFTVDEEPEQLGQSLQLPSWLEPSRDRIEQVLPSVRAPQKGA